MNPIRRRQTRAYIAIFVVAIFMTMGCGQRGDLYWPDNTKIADNKTQE